MVPAGLLLLPRHPTLGVPLGYGLVGFSTALALWVPPAFITAGDLASTSPLYDM